MPKTQDSSRNQLEYSNRPISLGGVIERVAGKPLAAVLTDRFFAR